MLDPLKPENSTIEGVPLKGVMIDAIVGAGFPTGPFADWAIQNQLAYGRRTISEIPMWDRTRLSILELDALFAIYGRQKRL